MRMLLQISMNLRLTRWFPLVCMLALPAIADSTPTHLNSQTKQNKQALEVTMLSASHVYKITDLIKLDIFLTNKSSKTIYVYRSMGFGKDASISLIVKDVSTKQAVPENFIADEIPPPPESKADFVRLDRGYVYGISVALEITNLNIVKKGTYEITAEYHSPMPLKYGFGLPIWSAEMGVVASNPVIVEIK